MWKDRVTWRINIYIINPQVMKMNFDDDNEQKGNVIKWVLERKKPKHKELST